MSPRLASKMLSFHPGLLGALTLVAACAHGLEAAPPDDAGSRGGSAGTSGEGGAEMAGSAGNGGSSMAGLVELGGGGSAGSEVAVDAGGDEPIVPISDGGLDAAEPTDAKADAAPIDAGPKHPTGITMSATSVASARQAPSAGGGPSNDECPMDQALVGFRGTIQTYVDGGNTPTNLRTVQGVCAPLSVSAMAPYVVTVGATNLLPLRGILPTPATSQTMNCPANQVVIGFQGRQAQFIEGLQMRCAPLVIAGASPTFTIALGAITTTGMLGSTTAGATFPAIDCPAGQVAVAQAPRAGSAIDSFGVICRTPTLVIQ